MVTEQLTALPCTSLCCRGAELIRKGLSRLRYAPSLAASGLVLGCGPGGSRGEPGCLLGSVKRKSFLRAFTSASFLSIGTPGARETGIHPSRLLIQNIRIPVFWGSLFTNLFPRICSTAASGKCVFRECSPEPGSS